MGFLQEVTGGGGKAKGPPTSCTVSLNGTVGRTRLQIFSFNISHYLNFSVQRDTLMTCIRNLTTEIGSHGF